LPSVCKQSKKVNIGLYTGNGIDISDDRAELAEKTVNKAEETFAISDIKV